MQFVLARLWCCNVPHTGGLLGWQQGHLKQSCNAAVFQKGFDVSALYRFNESYMAGCLERQCTVVVTRWKRVEGMERTGNLP